MYTRRRTLVVRAGSPESSTTRSPEASVGSGTAFTGGFPTSTSGETSLTTRRCSGVPYSATVNDDAPHYDAAEALAKAHARETGGVYIGPCSGDELLAGQGTVALEILEALPSLRTLVVNVGSPASYAALNTVVET